MNGDRVDSEKNRARGIAPRSSPFIGSAAWCRDCRMCRVDSPAVSRLNRGRHRAADPRSKASSRVRDARHEVRPAPRASGASDIGSADTTRAVMPKGVVHSRADLTRAQSHCRGIKDGAAASGELTGSRRNRPPPFPSTPIPPPLAIPSSLTSIASRTVLCQVRSHRDPVEDHGYGFRHRRPSRLPRRPTSGEDLARTRHAADGTARQGNAMRIGTDPSGYRVRHN
jgi:hypothetical protein